MNNKTEVAARPATTEYFKYNQVDTSVVGVCDHPINMRYWSKKSSKCLKCGETLKH